MHRLSKASVAIEGSALVIQKQDWQGEWVGKESAEVMYWTEVKAPPEPSDA